MALHHLDAESVDFVCSGPNCSRLGDKVLRSYDARFRPTQRRFDVDLAPDVESEEVLCAIAEDRHASTLNAESAGRYPDNAWLRKEQGSLVVLATKYHEGRHWTDSFPECIAVVRALETLHKEGFVHGDIRAFNIVFGAGVLIDFDFGGKVDPTDGTPAFPRGYERDLPDGKRKAKVWKPILMHRDWYALLKVLTVIHEIWPMEPYASRLDTLHTKLLELNDSAPSLYDLTKEGGVVECTAAAALDFLETAEANGCTLARSQ